MGTADQKCKVLLSLWTRTHFPNKYIAVYKYDAIETCRTMVTMRWQYCYVSDKTEVLVISEWTEIKSKKYCIHPCLFLIWLDLTSCYSCLNISRYVSVTWWSFHHLLKCKTHDFPLKFFRYPNHLVSGVVLINITDVVILICSGQL